jgi:hypothetical protein
VRVALSDVLSLILVRVFDALRLQTFLLVSFCDSIDSYFAGPFESCE